MFSCAFATANRRQAMFWAGRLIEVSPGRAESWLKLAICWMANRVGFEARNAIERAMELDPGNSYYRRFWIECDDSDPDL
jgi:Flp pilus assembly protein TadD